MQRSVHELLPPIALRIEQRRQVGVVDPRMGRGGDGGLGAEGDAEAGLLQHGEVVGAVADGHRRPRAAGRGGRAAR